MKSVGSGFAVKISQMDDSMEEKRQILTNDHVVKEASSVQIKKPGNPKNFAGTVLCNGQDVDLALVEVNDEKFWEDLPTMALRDILPTLDEDVTVLGQPQGGDGLSVTRGVVSRIDLSSSMLCAQIDAALNPGNSGGPCLDRNGNVLGVAFGGLSRSQNIGQIISVEVINNFLYHYMKWGQFRGLSRFQARVQNLESIALRKSLSIPDDIEGGVRVASVCQMSNLSK